MANELAKTQQHGLSVSGQVHIGSTREVFALAEALAKAKGFVPRSLAGDPNAIAAAILTGIELGMGPMEAMRSIHMVEGKPTMAAEVMLARALKAGVRWRWLQTTSEIAECEIEGTRMAFTMRDAQAAGVAGKDNWRKYPAAMLRARCISAAVRAVRPDVLGPQVYTQEELQPDARVVVDSQNMIVETVHEGPANAPVHVSVLPSLVTSAPARAQLSDVTSEAELVAWCAANAANIAKTDGARRDKAKTRIVETAQGLECDPVVALEAAGLAIAECAQALSDAKAAIEGF